MFFAPLTITTSIEQLSSIAARYPVLTSISCPALSSYSAAYPSISINAVPWPLSLCMMKPSPPKMPEPSFFWKCMDSSTPSSEARNALFCTIME